MGKFCANLSFMFTEVPFLERYKLAKDAGFKCVETGFPFGFTVEQVAEARKSADIEQVLINVFTGDVTKGELGFAAIPGKETEFKESIATTIRYAKALGAKKIHVMAGKLDSEPTNVNYVTYESNLRYAVKLFADNNIIGLIEPINKHTVPGYYLNSYDNALSIINSIRSPNLRLLLDIFHLQQIQGDITHFLQKYLKYTGHIQIAQVPNRYEPDASGEINYCYVLNLLYLLNYNDWIGLEYKPAKETIAGLEWIDKLGFKL